MSSFLLFACKAAFAASAESREGIESWLPGLATASAVTKAMAAAPMASSASLSGSSSGVVDYSGCKFWEPSVSADPRCDDDRAYASVHIYLRFRRDRACLGFRAVEGEGPSTRRSWQPPARRSSAHL